MTALKERCMGDDKDKVVMAEYDKIISNHSRGHLDQQLYVAPILKTGTSIFIVDLLHCVQLNVAKTA
eukprot:1728569-Pleurochrysis_carterae.AAC.2